MSQIINYNCDGQGANDCTGEHSEVRVLPLGNNGSAGNIIVCRNHFNSEMKYRREWNQEHFGSHDGRYNMWIDDNILLKFDNPCAFKIEFWTQLKVYNTSE